MDSAPHVVEDCMGLLKLFSDGSIYRCSDAPFEAPMAADGTSGVWWTDYLYDQQHKLHLRLYRPSTTTSKLPILFYIRGGGFCFGSRTWSACHNWCVRLASELCCLVVSPDCRLAPEHRLPAALEDALCAMQWLEEQGEHDVPWLCEGVAFDHVFVVGNSSGGNIAHHLAVRIGSGSVAFRRIHVRGYLLLAPFFGGTVRTKSENGPPEALLSIDLLDRLWRLSLPAGETADHPLANPFAPGSTNLDTSITKPMLVVVGAKELMRDRIEGYAARLKEMGRKVQFEEFEGQQHNFFQDEPFSSASVELLNIIKSFMTSSADGF